MLQKIAKYDGKKIQNFFFVFKKFFYFKKKFFLFFYFQKTF